MDTLALKKTANEIRKGIVTAVHSAKSGHPGGSLSAADILTYLYFEEMNVDPKDPKKADRDRFVLSKGHIAPALYATLAEKGYFPKEDLKTLRHVGSYLQGVDTTGAGDYFAAGFLYGLTCGYSLEKDRKSTRLNSSHIPLSRMPSSA